jgi:hypothetical protein
MQLRESQQSKNLSIGGASLVRTEISGLHKTTSVTDLGGPPVNAIWLIDYIVIKYTFFTFTRSGALKLGAFATPIGRVLVAGVIIGEVQAQKAELKANTAETKKEVGPLTLAFQFAQPPIVPFGQDLVAEVELEGDAGAAGPSLAVPSLSGGNLSMGYTYKQIRGYGRDKP